LAGSKRSASFRRVDWDRELETLIVDGIFDPANRAQFERDFTNTKRGAATPRPGLCLFRTWKPVDTLAGGFAAELSGVLSQALSVLGESHAEGHIGGGIGSAFHSRSHA
jgi:hypothetical protein